MWPCLNLILCPLFLHGTILAVFRNIHGKHTGNIHNLHEMMNVMGPYVADVDVLSVYRGTSSADAARRSTSSGRDITS